MPFRESGMAFLFVETSKFEKISVTRLYYLRWPIVRFLIGLGMHLIGALFMADADLLLTLGTIFSVAAVLFAIIKLILLKKQQ